MMMSVFNDDDKRLMMMMLVFNHHDDVGGVTNVLWRHVKEVDVPQQPLLLPIDSRANGTIHVSAVAAHGECSARDVSRQTRMSYGSIWKALRITLKRYPYKLQHKQELKPPDSPRFCEFGIQ
ncbi:hypothetical protein CEXT_3021 [Caerostris extrusa]|uniref:Uncharacterized protein n=1 Tax=Caerostris extrusa TaxID=172846 RepID=A0AAV4ME63_CAEEX|nr:hypothetical protein CEXT_3021 [Caerostris extrusa]